MTFTLLKPPTGRIGPGNDFMFSTDFVGPVVPGTFMVVTIQNTTTHVPVLSMGLPQVALPYQAGVFGARVAGWGVTAGANGLPDGDPVEIRAYWLTPGSGITQNIVFTGFSWDPTSNLYAVEDWLYQFSGVSSAVGTKLDEILASVKKTYSNP